MYRLPYALRAVLAQPFGTVYGTARALKEIRGRTVIAVGDVVTETLLKNDVLPKLMVVDGVTHRDRPMETALDLLPGNVRRVNVRNPPGEITQPLIVAMDRAMREKGNTVIIVQGEEDLAALPAMLMAPDGTAVLYGQPPRRSNEPEGSIPADGGVVVVLVTPGVRARAKDILSQMEVK